MNSTRQDLAPSKAAGSSDSPDAPSADTPNGWRINTELGCIASICALVAAVFWRVIFCGQSISRLALLPEWDAAFSAFRKGTSAFYDPSLLQLFIPNYTFIAQAMNKGQLPLWNPHNGFGCPFAGDIQSSLLSPLRLIFDFAPGLATYNLTLVGELLICALSSYALARAFGIGRCAALFASFAYCFCPFNLWYLELNLGTSGCLFPLVILLFVQAAKSSTLGSAMLAGAGSALLICSGHPESSFFGILWGCLLLVAMKLFYRGPAEKAETKPRLLGAFASAAKLVTVAGITCTGLAAPTLAPFLEYLKNSETYKYTSVCSSHVPWQGVISNLFNPAVGGASPHIGFIALVLLPFSLLALRGKTHRLRAASSLGLLLSSVVAFLLVTQLGPIELLFTKVPMTYVITRYLAPVLLLLLACLSAVGLEELLARIGFADLREERSNGKLADGAYQAMRGTARIAFLTALAASAAGALYLTYLHRNDLELLQKATFDLMLPATAFNAAVWKRDIWLSGGLMLALSLFSWIQAQTKSRAPLAAGTVLVCLTLNAFSLEPAIKLSLPLQPSTFFYNDVPVLQDLQDPSARMLSTGDHLLRPATNAVYEVNSIQAHNPLFPKRFLTFMRACEAKIDMFNQTFATRFNPLLDLAAVRYVVTQLPVFSADWQRPTPTQTAWLTEAPVGFGSCQLKSCQTWLDANAAAAGGTVAWNVTGDVAPITWALSLVDDAGNAVWVGEQTPVSGGSQDFLLPVPKQHGHLRLCLKTFNRDKLEFLKPDTSADHVTAGAVVLSEVSASQNNQTIPGRLQLKREYANNIRVYENTHALPRSYVVFDRIDTSGEEASLAAIQSANFDPTRQVVLEDAPKSPAAAPAEPSSVQPKTTLTQPNANTINIATTTDRDGYLVLADNWYPGWQARIDGQEAQLLRANYIFKAIALPAGSHQVVFSYDPDSFKYGLLVLATTLAIGAGCLLTRQTQRPL